MIHSYFYKKWLKLGPEERGAASNAAVGQSRERSNE